MELYRRKQEDDQDGKIDDLEVKRRTEIKYLTSDQSQSGLATLSDLQMDNLEIGKGYWLDMKGRFALGLIRFARMTAKNNGVLIAEINQGNSGGSSGTDITSTDRQYFVATATTVIIEIFHGVANTGAPSTGVTTQGDSTSKETCVRITEADDEVEVTGVF